MLEIFDSFCVLLAKAEQRHFLYTKKMLDDLSLEISPSQLMVLYTLYKKDNISISELSKNVFLDNSTLTGIIDRLSRADLVQRADAPNDRRSYQIVLTEKANELKPILLDIMKSVETKMLEGFSMDEKELLRRSLMQIFDKMAV